MTIVARYECGCLTPVCCQLQIVREEIQQLRSDEIIGGGPIANDARWRRGVFAIGHSLFSSECAGREPEMIHTGDGYCTGLSGRVSQSLGENYGLTVGWNNVIDHSPGQKRWSLRSRIRHGELSQALCGLTDVVEW